MKRFLERVAVRSVGGPWSARRVRSELGGHMFLGGAYRCHAEAVAAVVLEACEQAFPAYRGQWTAFGGDWMGRTFVEDAGRGGLISIVDLGFGEVLEAPASLELFHDEELLEFADASVLAGLLQEWVGRGNPVPAQSQCAGYRHPPILGGGDDLSNVELCDLGVYIELSAQICRQVRGHGARARPG